MHHPQSSQQGPPPTSQSIQHPRSGIIQQHNIEPSNQSPHQQQAHQGGYAAAQHPHPGLSHHQPPYLDTAQASAPAHPSHNLSYYSQQSPYSTHSATSGYSSGTGTSEMMAAAHTLRPQLTPLYPQSNVPTSAHSPQDPHGRGFYAQQPGQPLHYPSYPAYSPQQYSPHPAMGQHPMAMPYQPQHQPQHYGSHPHTPIVKNSPRAQTTQTPMQRPGSGMVPPQLTGNATTQHMSAAANSAQAAATNPQAAPGPIPATTPLLVKQDSNGVQWISFDYSRDRIKMEYTIRCDVESVNVDELDDQFKQDNCVYPRACKKDEYRGNRIKYETDCNTVGWALAKLNPSLRSKRGLIQRAVDSWRNSNQDQRLRSRRVRRLAKMNKRNQQATVPQHTQVPSHGAPMVGGEPPGSAGIPAVGGPGHPGVGMGAAQLHHHHAPDGGQQSAGDDGSGASRNFRNGNHQQNQPTTNGPVNMSSHAIRQSHSFYPTYPIGQSVGSTTVPHMPGGMDHLGSHSAGMARVKAIRQQDDEEPLDNKALFGDLPKDSKQSFFLIEDIQRNQRVRVNIKLQDVNMDEMPDNHCKKNSVYPRSFSPRHAPSNIISNDNCTNDDEVGNIAEPGNSPNVGKTLVPVSLLDGSEAKLPVPRVSKAQRRKEAALNSLGYRMTWRQNTQLFSGRNMFLQRSLDTYRQRTREAMVAQGLKILPHFKQRSGKLRWLAKTSPVAKSPKKWRGDDDDA